MKDGGEVVVGVVGDARGRDGLEELDGGELGGERGEVLVDERAEGHALLVQVQHHVHALAGLVHLLRKGEIKESYIKFLHQKNSVAYFELIWTKIS